MKKHLIIWAVALFCVFASSPLSAENCEDVVAKPTPAMAVTDFANVIDDDMQSALENKLRAYFENTTIAMAVVVVPTMGGLDQNTYSVELFNCWGIGGQNDCGILIFISVEERKLSIRTGRGIEFIATDADLSSITTDAMKPHLKINDYTTGIASGVNKIIEHLNTMSKGDLKDLIHKEQLAKEKAAQEAAYDRMVVAYIAVGIILLIVIFFLLRRIIRNLKIRKQISTGIANLNKEIVAAEKQLAATLLSYKGQPTWAHEEAAAHEHAAKTRLVDAQNLITKAISVKRTDYEDAYALVLQANSLVKKAFENFKKMDGALKEKIQKFSKEAPVRLAEAKMLIESNIAQLNEHIKNSYRFASYLQQQESLRSLIAQHESNLKNIERHADIYHAAETIKNTSAASMSEVIVLLTNKKAIEDGLEPTRAQAETLTPRRREYASMINQWKDQYPKTVWGKFETEFDTLFDRLSPTRLNRSVDEIQNLASMEAQNFALAYAKYKILVNSCNDVEQFMREMTKMEENQMECKNQYDTRYQAVKSLLEKVYKIIKNTDVETSTRNSVKDASKLLDTIVIEQQQSLVDWALIISSLENLMTRLKKAKNQAEEDISSAENERAARARRAAQRSSSNDDYSFSTSSLFSSHLSGTSDFGGFGGGSSGGGGIDTSF